MSAAEGGDVRLRVLVVDDEPLICRVAERVLSGTCDVATVTSAEAALSTLGAGAPFDAIVCDVRMPGVGGVELFRRVVARWPELRERFVFVTGGGESDDLEVAATGRQRLTKPFAPDALRAAIRGVTAAPPRP